MFPKIFNNGPSHVRIEMNRINNLDIIVLSNRFKRMAYILERLPKALPPMAGDKDNLLSNSMEFNGANESYFLSDIFSKQRKRASMLVLPTTKIDL